MGGIVRRTPRLAPKASGQPSRYGTSKTMPMTWHKHGLRRSVAGSATGTHSHADVSDVSERAAPVTIWVRWVAPGGGEIRFALCEELCGRRRPMEGCGCPPPPVTWRLAHALDCVEHRTAQTGPEDAPRPPPVGPRLGWPVGTTVGPIPCGPCPMPGSICDSSASGPANRISNPQRRSTRFCVRPCCRPRRTGNGGMRDQRFWTSSGQMVGNS